MSTVSFRYLGVILLLCKILVYIYKRYLQQWQHRSIDFHQRQQYKEFRWHESLQRLLAQLQGLLLILRLRTAACLEVVPQNHRPLSVLLPTVNLLKQSIKRYFEYLPQYLQKATFVKIKNRASRFVQIFEQIDK